MKCSVFRSSLWIVLAVPVALLVSMVSVSSVSAHQAKLDGRVVSGDTSLASYTVTLYGTRRGMCADKLGVASTDTNGAFAISYKTPRDTDAVLYLIATSKATMHGRAQMAGKYPTSSGGAASLASVLGTAPVPANVFINELTTVASAYALAQFVNGPNITGEAPGLQNAAAMAQESGERRHGSSRIGSHAVHQTGWRLQTWREFNSLANLLATCVNDACNMLVALCPGDTTWWSSASRYAASCREYRSLPRAMNVSQLFNQSKVHHAVRACSRIQPRLPGPSLSGSYGDGVDDGRSRQRRLRRGRQCLGPQQLQLRL